MTSPISEPQDNWRDWTQVFASMLTELRTPDPLLHFARAGAAFLIYETLVVILMDYLGAHRRPALLFIEFFAFGLVAVCLFLYSRAAQWDSEQQLISEEILASKHRTEMLRVEAQLVERMRTFSEGIEHSLAAIMFFARTQLVRAASPQMERDLREVMERIDQVQLLLDEMKRSIAPRDSWQTPPSSLPMLESPGLGAEALNVPGSSEFKQANRSFSLRKSARKVVIVPITVNYLSERTWLQFHTYTVNVCEDGACIMFSEQELADEGVIGIQMSPGFQAEARIRWIQPARENSFRLAGIQFVSRQVEIKSL